MNNKHLLKVALLLIILLLISFVLLTSYAEEKDDRGAINILGEPTCSEKVVVKNRSLAKSRYLSTSNEISPSRQTSHSKAEIIQKYNEANYTLTNATTYQTDAVLTGPNYREATLTSLARNDTLKQLNFYRYLAGTNEVSIYEDMMNNNGKGAVLLSVSNFSHYPNKPKDMSDEFYQYALYGTSYPPHSLSGYSSSGNIAEGTNMSLPKSIKGYVDDTFNVVANSVGHRLSLLSPYAQKTSFGCAPSINYENTICSTITMYSTYDSSSENSYYTWPPAGYCPIEVTDSNELWSITLGGNLEYNISTMKIVLTCDGTKYEVGNEKIYGSSYYNSFFFALPSELISKIDGGNLYLPDKKIDVEIINGVFRTSNNGTYTDPESIDINYSVEFFTIESIPVTSMSIYQKDISDEGNWYTSFTSLEGYKNGGKELLFQILPEDATDTRYNVVFTDSTIASYDKTNRIITFKKAGTTKCTISLVSNPSIKKEFSIIVHNKVESIAFEKESYSVDVGETVETSVRILPTNNVLAKDKVVTYLVEDETIASIDSNGIITGLKVGNTNVIAKINENIKSIAHLEVNEILTYTTMNTETLENVDNVVLKFDSKTSLGSILTEETFPVLNKGYTVSICDKDGKTKSNTENIGSRNIIKILDDKGNVISEFVVIVKGDITGNGKIELFDSFKILIGCISKPDGSDLDSLDKAIRDFNNDGAVTLFDAFKFLIMSLQS